MNRNLSRLVYTRAADTWADALPLGNGRLGAMVYGHTGVDRFQLNEDSLWYGKATDLSLYPNSPGYRLILNNILFPAAKKEKHKT